MVFGLEPPQRRRGGLFGMSPKGFDWIGELEEYEGSELEERLNMQHPSYKANLPVWEEIKDFVDGTCREKAQKYTPQHIGEDPEVYRERVKTFTYTPVLARSVRSFVACLSKGSVTINTVSKSLQQTRDKMNPMQFASDSMRMWLLYGVLCCTYDVKDGVVIPVLVDPATCINWEPIDDRGSLEFAVIKTNHIRSRKLDKPQRVQRWQLYDQQGLKVYEKVDDTPVKLVNVIRLGGCPVLRFEPPKEGWTAAQAVSQQITYTYIENARMMAGRSMYIQRTVTPVLAPDDDLTETYTDAPVNTTFNNDTITCSKFEFVEPVGSSVETLGEMLKDIERQIRSLISMSAPDSQSIRESGESKRYDYAELSMTLQFIGSHLRQWIKRVMEMLAVTSGEWASEDVEVAGLNSFEVNNLEYLLSVAHTIEGIRHNIAPSALESFYQTVNSLVSGAQTREEAEKMKRELKATLNTPPPADQGWER